MKKYLAIAAAGLLGLGTAAMADVTGTHHDMTATGQVQGDQKCAFCHSKTGITPQTSFGTVGSFCVAVCHLANTTGTAAIPSSPEGFTWAAGVFAPGTADNTTTPLVNGHKMTVANLTTISATEGAAVAATGWPHTGNAKMECTSCHAVHDAANPPFLNQKLNAGFCQKCHLDSKRETAWAAAPKDHPTGMKFDGAAAALRGTNAEQRPVTTGAYLGNRRIAVGALTNNINVDTGVAAATNMTTFAQLATNHWNMGGHLIDSNGMPGPAGSAAGSGDFTCVSCHAVHQSASATGAKASAYLVGANLDTVCFGCHSKNPGMTNFGHPINNDTMVNTWTIPLAAGYTGQAAPYNAAPYYMGQNAPNCVSCHEVHGGVAGYMAIRPLGTITATVESVCEFCHAGSFDPAAATANSHHPGVAGTNYTAAADGTFTATLPWLTADGNGDLNDGLSCSDCHIGDGTTNKRTSAHNWQ